MKFGIFYEHQLPRPWGPKSEYQLLQDSLTHLFEVQRISKIGSAPQFGAHTRGCDEGLGRHAVEQDARAADAVAVDDGDAGDLRAAGSGDKCRLISGGSAADDHDAGSHRTNLTNFAH